MLANRTTILAAALVLATAATGRCQRHPVPGYETELKRGGVGVSTAELIAFLTKHTADERGLRDRGLFAQQLQSKDAHVRETAARRLAALGPAGLPALRPALASDQPRLVRMVRACITEAPDDGRGWLGQCAVRAIVDRAPPNAVEVLLRYLPSAFDAATVEEVCFGIDDLTVRQKRIAPVQVAALSDPLPERRALAGCIVARRGDAGQRATARDLLKDTDATVRLRTAQGLLAAGEKDAIPVLIALLNDPSIDAAWQAEELLHWAARATAPAEVLGACRAEERQRCLAAWQAWWQRHGPGLSLAERSADQLLPNLLLIWDEDGGRVCSVGCDGRLRWSLKTPPLRDVRWLPGGRVLLAEPDSVSERELTGQVRFRRDGVEHPIYVERLANGNTFIVERGRHVWEITPQNLIELEREYPPPSWAKQWKVVWLSAARHSDGTLLCINSVRGKGKEQERYLIAFDSITNRDPPEVYCWKYPCSGASRVEAVAPGRLLCSNHPGGIVFENPIGGGGISEPWCQVPGSRDAIKLRGARMLACGGGRVVELDRRHQVAWAAFLPFPTDGVRAPFPLLRLGFHVAPFVPVDLADQWKYRLNCLRCPGPEVRRQTLQWLGAKALNAAYANPTTRLGVEGLARLVRLPARFMTSHEPEYDYPLAALLLATKHPDPKVRMHAVGELGNHRSEGRMIAPWLITAALEDEDPKVRMHAANRFSFGRQDIEHIKPAILKALNDADEGVRWGVCMGVGKLGRDAQSLIPVFQRLLIERPQDAQKWRTAIYEIEYRSLVDR